MLPSWFQHSLTVLWFSPVVICYVLEKKLNKLARTSLDWYVTSLNDTYLIKSGQAMKSSIIKLNMLFGSSNMFFDGWAADDDLAESRKRAMIILASLSLAQCSLLAVALELAPDTELSRVLYEIPRFQVEPVIGWNLIHCT